jgi:hypothetical protein
MPPRAVSGSSFALGPRAVSTRLCQAASGGAPVSSSSAAQHQQRFCGTFPGAFVVFVEGDVSKQVVQSLLAGFWDNLGEGIAVFVGVLGEQSGEVTSRAAWAWIATTTALCSTHQSGSGNPL